MESKENEKRDLLDQVATINDQYKALHQQLEDMKKLLEAQEVEIHVVSKH